MELSGLLVSSCRRRWLVPDGAMVLNWGNPVHPMKKTKKPAKKTKAKVPATAVKKLVKKVPAKKKLDAPKDSADQKEAKRIKALKISIATVADMSVHVRKCDDSSSQWDLSVCVRCHNDKEAKESEALEQSEEWRKFVPKGFIPIKDDYSGHNIKRSGPDAFKYLKLCGYKSIHDVQDLLKQKKKTAFQVTETYNGEAKPLYKQKVTYWESNDAARYHIEENFPDVSFNEHAGAVEEDIFDGDAIEDGIICKVIIVVREVPYKQQKLEPTE